MMVDPSRLASHGHESSTDRHTAREHVSFDPDRIEYTRTTRQGYTIELYTVDPHTDDSDYVGYWGYRVRRGDTTMISGEDLYIAIPSSHHHVSHVVLYNISIREGRILSYD